MEYPINLDTAGAPQSHFDRMIEWLLISLLAFMPLAFGAVDAWSEQVVVALAAAISLCFLLKLVFEKDTHLVWSWAYVPVALFILVAVLQLIPLSAGLVSAISPSTAATKKELLGDLPNSAALLSNMTLSFYPNATKHDLRLVLAVAAIFFVVLNVFRKPEQIKRLLATIAIIGGSIAVLALAQDLFGNGKIYWFISLGGRGAGKANSGTFVNHSHYGQFMNLSIGAALGLIMVKIHEAFTGSKATPTFIVDHLSSPASRMIWLLVAMIIIGVATVFVSLTRGGMISMLIAAGFTTVILSSRRSLRGHSWITVLMALGAFLCVLYVGFDAVYDRLGSLREFNQYQGRWQIVKDLSASYKRFPAIGTGLGTHEVVYPMFERGTYPSLFTHAENEYAQAAEETGLVGLAVLVGFGIIVWASYVRNVARPSVPIRSAAYGLGFGLLAIMLHSLSDFGQHLPANAVLSGVSCAILIALSSVGRKDGNSTCAPRPGSRSLRFAVLVCVSGVWGWALLGVNNARLAEAHWKKALAVEQSLMDKDMQAGDDEYRDLISNAAIAISHQPDNIKYQHGLNAYRWASISRITDPNTGEIIIPDQAMQFVHRIVDELHNARLLCPTYGAVYCFLGQLERSILNDPNGADRIRKGYQLAPCDPTACFVAGLLDAEERRVDASFEKLSKAVELDGRFFEGAAKVYIYHLSRPDLAVALAGDSTGRLSHVADALAGVQEHQDIGAKAQARIIELLEEKCSGPDASASTFASLANIYSRNEDDDAAIVNYRRALELDYGHVQWRFALAKLLAESEQINDAIHEARICLRLSPKFDPAERLIAELSILPAGATEDSAP
jgi:O-antigen ligase